MLLFHVKDHHHLLFLHLLLIILQQRIIGGVFAFVLLLGILGFFKCPLVQRGQDAVLVLQIFVFIHQLFDQGIKSLLTIKQVCQLDL